MVKKETTGDRPTNYSSWHRTLPNDCYAIDIDWVECRTGFLPKALIETSEINYEYVNEGEEPYLKTMWFVLRRTWLQRGVLYHISKKLDIKAFIVIHDPVIKPENFLLLEVTAELNNFDWKKSNFKDINRLNPIMLSEEDYRKFLINL